MKAPIISAGIVGVLTGIALALALPVEGTDRHNVQIPVHATGVDSDAWATVPSGEFLAGAHRKRMVIPYDYAIMVTPVTNAQYARYLNRAIKDGLVSVHDDVVMGPYPGDKFNRYHHEREIAAGDKPHLMLNGDGLAIRRDGATFSVTLGREDHPVVQVTWFGARAYCAAHGARLPSELEWEKAARGTDGRSYPWGDQITAAHANLYASQDPFESGFGKQGTTTPVGFYNGRTYGAFATRDSRSPYGAYDMAGNVWNWAGDIYPDTHYRWMRGGSKNSYDYELRVYSRNSAVPDFHAPNVGFRCARGG